MNTMQLITRPTLPSNKFSGAAEFGQTHSSRSLANRIKNVQNDQKIDFYSYTQKLQNDTLISSEKSNDNSVSYQHSEYNNTHKNTTFWILVLLFCNPSTKAILHRNMNIQYNRSN